MNDVVGGPLVAPRRARILWQEGVGVSQPTGASLEEIHCELLVSGRVTVGSGKEAVVRVGDPYRNTRPAYERPELLVAPVHTELTIGADHLVVHHATGPDGEEARLPLPRGGEARLRIGLYDVVVQAADEADTRVLPSHEPDAKDDVPLLIRGDRASTGLVAARAIHERTRAGRPLVFVDCEVESKVFAALLFGFARSVSFAGQGGQIYRGALEAAQGGTLFLRELAAFPKELQANLTRALVEKRFRRVGDNRFQTFAAACVATTERDLGELVAREELRADLYEAFRRHDVRDLRDVDA